MKLKVTSILLLIVVISYSNVQSQTINETPTDPTDSLNVDDLNKKTTTTTTTTPEPSTTVPSTIPTTKPTTTTTTSTTTTTTTTTENPTTQTTTTTTTEPPNPTPTPLPETGKWFYKDGNVTCILIGMAMRLNVSYDVVDGQRKTVIYNVPVKDSMVTDGSCNSTLNVIKVKMDSKTMNDNTFTILFNKIESHFVLSTIVFNMSFPNSKLKNNIYIYNVTSFETPLDMSYHCEKNETLDFTKETNGTLTISHLQLEAFHKTNATQFSTAKDCDAIDTPDIVPIVVGCALAALVIAVLISYLIGRRREHARGYLSM